MKSNTKKIMRNTLLATSAALVAMGPLTAFAGDTTAEEREWLRAFNEIPNKQVVWTAEEMQAGAELASRLDREGGTPFAETLKPQESVSWSSEEMRAGAELAEKLNKEA